MNSRDVIVQQMMLHEVIFSRKAALDQFQEGLCVLNFIELLQQFPVLFEPLFVCASASSDPTPDMISSMLRANPSTSDQEKTYSFLKEYISSLSIEGQ